MAAVVALVLIASGAVAQSDAELAGARASATAGAKAFSQGDYKKAVDMFKRAEELVHAPTHLLYLARSYAKLGRLVDAAETYRKITREKLAADAPDAFKDAQGKANTELAALEPRVPSLTITLKGDGAAGATVTMDGTEVPSALVGVPHPVDPGTHKLVASGNGVQSDPATVTLEEGGKQTVELTLQAAPGATAHAAAGAGISGGTTSPGGDKGAPSHGGNGMRIGAYVALGVGVVGVAAGTIFALGAKSKFNDANNLCDLPGGACPADRQSEIQSLDDSGTSKKTLATVGFIVGGVGLATGVTLFILSGKKQQEKAHAGIHPWVGLGSAGVSGRF